MFKVGGIVSAHHFSILKEGVFGDRKQDILDCPVSIVFLLQIFLKLKFMSHVKWHKQLGSTVFCS